MALSCNQLEDAPRLPYEDRLDSLILRAATFIARRLSNCSKEVYGGVRAGDQAMPRWHNRLGERYRRLERIASFLTTRHVCIWSTSARAVMVNPRIELAAMSGAEMYW